ncbi:MAG: serine/threonine-protein kinase, partial [Longimicrobiales bacterium]
MSTDGLADLEALFHRVLDGTPAERAALLKQLRAEQPALHAEVLALLAAHETHGPVDELSELVNREANPVPASSALPERVGAYRVVELIAQGGMGSVYLAQRADGQFDQRVALKLMRSDMDDAYLRDRFLDERRILARIEHPNIARLLDGGFTENGQPYFAMEYVEGQPIDRYCAAHALSLRVRLALFRTVCLAVQFAHQNLVVHRDIKPANVLVAADGTVKLLDFGIARLVDPQLLPDTEARTRVGLRLLTPEYASPEQKAGEVVTTASDVYQLGLMLRQLITDSTAVPPDTSRGVPRDVLLIMGMATREEPARRYASAEQLAGDVNRYLNDMPVSARPDTVMYRTARFVSRHRFGVATAAAGVILLAGFAITTTLQGRRTARERDRAEQVTALLTSFFEASNPRVTRGDTLSVRDVLDRGATRVRSELREQPETQAALLYNLGIVYRQLGLLEQARTLFAEAMAVRRHVLPARHRDLTNSVRMMGITWTELGKPDSAVPLLREAANLVGRNDGKTSIAYANTIRDLAYGLQVANQGDEADQLYRQALAIHRVRRDTSNRDVATV